MVNKKKACKNSYSRFFATQILFSYFYEKNENIDDLIVFMEENYLNDEIKNYAEEVNKDFLEQLIKGVVNNLEPIDNILNENLKDKKLDDFLRTIFRLAVYEMKYTDTDKKVIVSEYVDIAGEYLTDKPVAFVNAMLDKIVF